MHLREITIILCVCLGISKQTSSSDDNGTDNTMSKKYKPEWSDLDTRPLPEWYDRAKIGIFVHWGVYAVSGFGSEWFWINWHNGAQKYVDYMKKNYAPGFTYQEFAPGFKAEFFEPEKWATLFAKSGAKYVVLTSKHHDGYCLFPSNRSFSWNSVDVGPKRDLVGELAAAIRSKHMKFGVYHSLFEWFNPIYLEDKEASFTTHKFTDTKLWPDIKQLINNYKPSVLWADGDWEAYDPYWRSTELLAWLYNDSPVKNEIVVNDRWGIGSYCKHGDFYNCKDRYNPGELQDHKWENAFTIDRKSWGFRKTLDISDVLTNNQILKEVVTSVSCGGNVLINVGPTSEGTIAPIFQERLLTLGKWLEVNGEAIYDTSPWKHQNDSNNGDVWYTCTKSKYNPLQPTAIPESSDTITAVYAIFLKWPESNVLLLKDLWPVNKVANITLLGNENCNLKWMPGNDTVEIVLPDKLSIKSQHAWTLKVKFH